MSQHPEKFLQKIHPNAHVPIGVLREHRKYGALHRSPRFASEAADCGVQQASADGDRLIKLTRLGAKTIKKNTNSTQKKSETHRAKQYEVTSFLSTYCELSTETCSKNVYSLGPRRRRCGWCTCSGRRRHNRLIMLAVLSDPEKYTTSSKVGIAGKW